MKIFVVYDTENENDVIEYERFKNVNSAFCLISEFESQLRSWWKYSEEAIDIETIRNRYYEIKSACFETDVE